MSRSYKRSPVYKEGSDRSKIRKNNKRQANKLVRKNMFLSRKSNDYRKSGMDSWEICDYRFFEPKIAGMSKEDLEHWKRYYFRK